MIAMSVRDEAARWLEAFLKGGPQPVTEIESRGAEACLGRHELLAAGLHLRIRVFGPAARRMWGLPEISR